MDEKSRYSSYSLTAIRLVHYKSYNEAFSAIENTGGFLVDEATGARLFIDRPNEEYLKSQACLQAIDEALRSLDTLDSLKQVLNDARQLLLTYPKKDPPA